MDNGRVKNPGPKNPPAGTITLLMARSTTPIHWIVYYDVNEMTNAGS